MPNERGARSWVLASVAATLGTACSPNSGSFGGTSGSESTTDDGATEVSDDTGPPPLEGPRRRRIDLDPSLTADAGGTTLLVVLDATRIEYDDAQPDGSDLRMRGPGDDGPFYPIEIERWDPSGRSYVWVRIDATPLPESIWMYYAEGKSYAAIDSAQVWDDAFAAVWHMALGGASRVTDSSGAGLDLRPIGFTGDFEVDGVAGLATFFVPPAMPVEAGPLELPDAEALALADGFTLEAWVWPAESLVPATAHVLRKVGAYELHAQGPMLARPRLELRTADGRGPHAVEVGASLVAHEWTYLAATYEAASGTLALYRNGELEGSIPVPGSPDDRAVAASAAVVQLGRDFNGMLDEVRVSSIARSAAWIRLQHAAMSDALMTFGPPEPQP